MRHITFLAIYAVIKNKKVSLFAWGWKGLKEKWVGFFKGVEKCWWKWWSWVGLLSCSMLCLTPFVIEASRYTQGWGWGGWVHGHHIRASGNTMGSQQATRTQAAADDVLKWVECLTLRADWTSENRRLVHKHPHKLSLPASPSLTPSHHSLESLLVHHLRRKRIQPLAVTVPLHPCGLLLFVPRCGFLVVLTCVSIKLCLSSPRVWVQGFAIKNV